MTVTRELRDAALASKAWPFEEARKLIARYKGAFPGCTAWCSRPATARPDCRTSVRFGEVARTTMVRRAFELIAPGVPTRLIAFSDDMDGFRKVPPGPAAGRRCWRAHLHQPLSRVPDPFGTHASYAAHNNARLRAFLDRFGFDYEFLSSTDCYTSTGGSTTTLRLVLNHYGRSHRRASCRRSVRSGARPIRRSCRCIR